MKIWKIILQYYLKNFTGAEVRVPFQAQMFQTDSPSASFTRQTPLHGAGMAQQAPPGFMEDVGFTFKQGAYNVSFNFVNFEFLNCSKI